MDTKWILAIAALVIFILVAIPIVSNLVREKEPTAEEALEDFLEATEQLAGVAERHFQERTLVAQEKTASNVLKAVSTGQALFELTRQVVDANGMGQYGTVSQLRYPPKGDEPFLTDSAAEILEERRGPYTYTLTPIIGNPPAFTCVAMPNKKGLAAFYVDENYIIHFDVDGKKPTANSPAFNE